MAIPINIPGGLSSVMIYLVADVPVIGMGCSFPITQYRIHALSIILNCPLYFELYEVITENRDLKEI